MVAARPVVPRALRTVTWVLAGTAAPGVWVAPATLYDEAARALDREGLSAYTGLFRGDYLGAGDVAARIGQWWDLDVLTGLYSEFGAAFRPVTRRRATLSPADAFAAYVPMLTAWRRLPYLDPGLPLEYLPPEWPGVEAAELFASLDSRLREGAHTHAHTIVRA